MRRIFKSRIFISFLITLAVASVMLEPANAWSLFHPLRLEQKEAKFIIPNKYNFDKSIHTKQKDDLQNAALISWNKFFSDPYLISLIETALANNQELNIFLQDIEIAKNEIKARRGEYLPKVGLGLEAEKYGVSRRTLEGKVDKVIDLNKLEYSKNNFSLDAALTWEVDIWKKLRNAKKASQMRLMAQYEGRNFLVTRLIAEISRSYYELMALDNSLKILDENIKIQEAAFIKMQALKEFAKSNQLAVNRFEAQLLETKSERFKVQQSIIEKENQLRFLSGTYDDKQILRNSDNLMLMAVDELQIGVPSELLENRPDIRQAEYAIKAAKLDLKSVKANLYPSVSIKADYAFSAFTPDLLLNPKSIAYDVLGNIMAPVINRQAIIAQIKNANSYQTQVVLSFEQTLLQAYTEVVNQMSKIKNLQQSFETKQKEVELLDDSVNIANSLFQYAKADYVEILLTQEAKLDAQRELVETKMNLIGSRVDLYRALGGGWR